MPVVAFRGPVLPDRGPPQTRAGDWQAGSISRPRRGAPDQNAEGPVCAAGRDGRAYGRPDQTAK
jgi:hypothetical protein